MERFGQKKAAERDIFIETELNIRTTGKNEEVDEVINQLNDVVQELARTKEDAHLNESKIREQEAEILFLKEKQAQFESELRKIKEERQAEPLLQPVNEPEDAFIESPVAEITGPQNVSAKRRSYSLSKAIAAITIALLLVGGLVSFCFKQNSPVLTVTNNVPVHSADSVVKEVAVPRAADTIVALAQAVLPTENKPVVGVINEARIKHDLIGRKLSGCDIMLKSLSEIKAVSGLSLVEKMQSGFLKYKCTVKIDQDGEKFTASPYVYYTSRGEFLKIDGTNCE
jgi:hypothetical protein